MPFFLHSKNFLYLSFCTRKSLLTFPGSWRLLSKLPVFRDNLYLQMLLDDTCLLVSSAWDFRILSCMLKMFLQNFYTLFLVYIFCIPKVFLNVFFAGCFFVAQDVFWFRRNVFTLNLILIRCILYVGYLQVLRKYL